jgi:hypothetical protein
MFEEETEPHIKFAGLYLLLYRSRVHINKAEAKIGTT